MDVALAELPDDVEALRSMIVAAREETARLRAERLQIEEETAAERARMAVEREGWRPRSRGSRSWWRVGSWHRAAEPSGASMGRA